MSIGLSDQNRQWNGGFEDRDRSVTNDIHLPCVFNNDKLFFDIYSIANLVK